VERPPSSANNWVRPLFLHRVSVLQVRVCVAIYSLAIWIYMEPRRLWHLFEVSTARTTRVIASQHDSWVEDDHACITSWEWLNGSETTVKCCLDRKRLLVYCGYSLAMEISRSFNIAIAGVRRIRGCSLDLDLDYGAQTLQSFGSNVEFAHHRACGGWCLVHL
jgi:hypothetical protein